MSNSENSVAPALELDFGIGRIYVQGDESTDFEDVVTEFNDQKDDMKETIEEFKRLEYELDEEYDVESGSPNSMVR